MGPVSRNQVPDPHSLELFDLVEPPASNGVVATSFRKDPAFDGYPVWTENKARLIERYVHQFIMVTKHGTYLDGFAGPQVEEYNDETWAAKRVLEIEPRWLRRAILCELEPSQVEHLATLKQERRKLGDRRKIEIYAGDFNQTVDDVLAAGHIREKEATFCLLDQRTFQCKWATVEKLARHKAERKIELFYFVPVGWLARAFANTRDASKLAAWWGRDDFELLRAASKSDTAAMFVERMRRDLGYASALAWPIHDRGNEGRVMYYMVHATDHPDAPKLMNRAYKKATNAADPPMEHVQPILDGLDLGERTSAPPAK